MSAARGAAFAGVLGWPLEHTLSPPMHNAAFRALGIDATYVAFPVPPGELAAAVAGLRALGALGANVTMPHKESVVELLDDLADDARRMGAVNTIARDGDRIVGHNTDVIGFRDFLTRDAGIDARGMRAVVLGAGGAARAVVNALGELGSEEIVVVGRRAARAETIAALARGARAAAWPEVGAAVGRADLVVNATPLGMGAEDPLAGVALHEGQAVVDLVYRPLETPLLARARAAGASAWGGLGMLVRQGAGSFRIWTGRDAPVEVMIEAASEASCANP
ncbi:MAG: shikimate dehydrogenase [Actinomycetota bacterium]